eukprot:jgi/Botrbrau1/19167/Bobra.0077s0076.2
MVVWVIYFNFPCCTAAEVQLKDDDPALNMYGQEKIRKIIRVTGVLSYAYFWLGFISIFYLLEDENTRQSRRRSGFPPIDKSQIPATLLRIELVLGVLHVTYFFYRWALLLKKATGIRIFKNLIWIPSIAATAVAASLCYSYILGPSFWFVTFAYLIACPLSAIFSVCLLLVLRGRRLPRQTLAVLLAEKAAEKERAEAAKELRKKNGNLTDEDRMRGMEEGVEAVATELVELRRVLETDVANLSFRVGAQLEDMKRHHDCFQTLGTQVEELNSQQQKLQLMLVRELAELRSLVKPH